MRTNPKGTLLIGLASASMAAAGVANAEGWENEVAPYLWGSGMDGKAGVGEVEADVDVSFGDILEDLEMGFMGAYKGQNEQYVVLGDAIYMGLGGHKKSEGGRLNADVDIDQIAVTVAVGYKLREQFAVYGGVRYNDVDATVKVTRPTGAERGSTGDTWLDPLIGAYYTWPINDHWSTTLQGDIGGFSVGSDFAWLGQFVVRWQMTPTLATLIGYRYFDMDFESGSGHSRFMYDIATQGPVMGLALKF
jgi:hypothetical protein